MNDAKTIYCTPKTIKGRGAVQFEGVGYDKVYLTCPKDWNDDQINAEVDRMRAGRSQGIYIGRAGL